MADCVLRDRYAPANDRGQRRGFLCGGIASHQHGETIGWPPCDRRGNSGGAVTRDRERAIIFGAYELGKRELESWGHYEPPQFCAPLLVDSGGAIARAGRCASLQNEPLVHSSPGPAGGSVPRLP